MKKIFILCLSLLTLTIVSSCGSDRDNEEIEESILENPIVGKWILDQEQVEMTTSAEGETYDHWKGNYESFRIGYRNDGYVLDTLFFSNPKFKQELLFTNKGKLKSQPPFTLWKDFVFIWMPLDADYKIIGNILHLKYIVDEEKEDGSFEKVNAELYCTIEFDDDFNTMTLKDFSNFTKVLQVYKRKK